MSLQDRELLEIVRQALLMLVDVLERKLEMPRTKDLRDKLRSLEFEKSSIMTVNN